MGSERTDDSSTWESLAPREITDRFDGLDVGDAFTVNGHERTYEVVDTDTYSVVAEDSRGHRVVFSQNLQSGGWSVNEEVFRVDTVTEP